MCPLELVLDGAAMARMLRGPSGLVATHLLIRTEKVWIAAIADCPKDTGDLSKSIHKRALTLGGSQLSIMITADAPYALPVHEGSKPHNIPGAFGYKLPFGIGGRFEGFFHPGHPEPRRFLTDNLHWAVD
jgi:hypothetical protein